MKMQSLVTKKLLQYRRETERERERERERETEREQRYCLC